MVDLFWLCSFTAERARRDHRRLVFVFGINNLEQLTQRVQDFLTPPTLTSIPTQIVPTSTPQPPLLTPTLFPTLPSPPTPRTAVAQSPPTNIAIQRPAFATNIMAWALISSDGYWQSLGSTLQGTVQEATDSFYMAQNITGANFSYDTTFSIINGTASAAAGVIFRSRTDPLQGSYMARISTANGGQINLVRFFPVRQYEQLAVATLPIFANTPYTLRVSANGADISIYLNDQLVLQANDATYLNGTVGLNVNGATAQFTSANLTN
ncbi:MAG: hypothetical protein IPO91_08430 [Chloroflexi bacterium]|nr:hypothetical protein [Chloroflexota bacterium]